MRRDDELKKLNDTEEKKPEYASRYQSNIDTLLSKLGQTQEPYDFSKDPMYDAYKANYVDMGAMAASNANADTQALSGGLGTTYGAIASGQASQQYLTEMNNVIPELYQAAVARYDAEQQQAMAQLKTLQDQESYEYGQYRDTTGDWQKDRDFQNKSYRDAVAEDKWQQEFDYTAERDKVKDEQWQKEFDENVRQFGLNYALAQARGSSGGGGGRSGGSGRSYGSGSSSSTKAVQNYSYNLAQIARQTNNTDAQYMAAATKAMASSGVPAATAAELLFKYRNAAQTLKQKDIRNNVEGVL